MKCVTQKNRKYSYFRSLRSEKNDGYVVFLDQYRFPHSLFSASCSNLNVSFIFCHLDELNQKYILDFSLYNPFLAFRIGF